MEYTAEVDSINRGDGLGLQSYSSLHSWCTSILVVTSIDLYSLYSHTTAGILKSIQQPVAGSYRADLQLPIREIALTQLLTGEVSSADALFFRLLLKNTERCPHNAGCQNF